MAEYNFFLVQLYTTPRWLWHGHLLIISLYSHIKVGHTFTQSNMSGCRSWTPTTSISLLPCLAYMDISCAHFCNLHAIQCPNCVFGKFYHCKKNSPKGGCFGLYVLSSYMYAIFACLSSFSALFLSMLLLTNYSCDLLCNCSNMASFTVE